MILKTDWINTSMVQSSSNFFIMMPVSFESLVKLFLPIRILVSAHPDSHNVMSWVGPAHVFPVNESKTTVCSEEMRRKRLLVGQHMRRAVINRRIPLKFFFNKSSQTRPFHIAFYSSPMRSDETPEMFSKVRRIKQLLEITRQIRSFD